MRGGSRSPWRPPGVIMRVCLVCAVGLLLGAGPAGCSFTSTPGPTNSGPMSSLRADILAAGITPLVGSGGPSEYAKKGELYLLAQATEGQDASATADMLLSLTQKYKEQLDLRWLHVVIQSDAGFYDRTFDLTTSPPSTS